MATLNHQTIKEFTDHQKATVTSMEDADQSLRECIESIQDLFNAQNSRARIMARRMARELWDSAWEPHLPDEEPSQSYTSALGDEASQEFRERGVLAAQRIVACLKFESLPHRHAAIPEASLRTYEWIFAEPMQSRWSCFTTWLEGPSDKAYWITGKPGAGKSTLMKFIPRHPRFVTHLDAWAGATPLLYTSFYAWNAGTDLQKSHEGFLRTMLSECIQQRPELASVLFPKRQALFQMWNDNTIVVCPFEYRELMDACKSVASGSGTAYKLFILVDGLDEFEETRSSTHDDLVTLLRELNRHEGVKICASSRPWNAFHDAFRQNPMLRLEQLTMRDIGIYIDTQLSENQGFWELRQVQSTEAAKLITDITSKAQGVFLWVTLVVLLLARQLRDGGSVSELQETLENLPDDLSSFYDHIWSRIEPQYRTEASQLLYMKLVSPSCQLPLYAPTLWYSLDSPETHISGTSTLVPWQPVLSQRLSRRLNSRTGGLLEVHEAAPLVDSRVEFLHRTVIEWATKNSATLMSDSESGYSPYLALLLGEALRISSRALNYTECEDYNEFTTYMVKISKCLSALWLPVDSPQNVLLIEALDCLERGLTGWYGGNSATLNLLEDSEGESSKEPEPGMEFVAFATLMARLPVVPYIKHRVQQNPSLLWFDGSIGTPSSLVGSVALGGDPVREPGMNSDAVVSGRVELLRFITGAEYYGYLNRRDIALILRLAPPGPIKDVLLAIPLTSLYETMAPKGYMDPYQPWLSLPGCSTFFLDREVGREAKKGRIGHRAGPARSTAPAAWNPPQKIAKRPVIPRWRDLMSRHR